MERSSDLLNRLNAKIKKTKGIINLAIGEPQAPLPDFVAQAAAEAIREERTGYAPITGDPELKEALAASLNCAPKNLLITNGGKSALGIVLKALLRQGGEVALASPYYPSFSAAIELEGGRPLFIETKNNDFKLDISLLEKLSVSPRALIINYPNNPTGTLLSRKDFVQISGWARRNSCYLISDEVYKDFYYGPQPPLSAWDFYAEKQGVIVLGSFSKSFNIPGLRLGYILAAPENIKKFARVAGAEYGCASSLAQRIGLAFLRKEKNYPAELRRLFSQSREMLLAWLNKKGIPYAAPEGAFYVFPDFKKNIKAKGFINAYGLTMALVREGVAIAPGVAFGDYRFYARISFCCPPEKVKEGIKRIEKVLK